MFTSKEHDYFIEPVPDYVTEGKVSSGIEEQPHLVFRRSVNDRFPLRQNDPRSVMEEVLVRSPRSCGTKGEINSLYIAVCYLLVGSEGFFNCSVCM